MIRLLIIACAVTLVSCKNDNKTNERAEPIIVVDEFDKEMNFAIQKAKNSVDTFIQAYTGKKNLSGFYVKVPYENPDEVEHLWINVISISGSQIKGLIENTPNERTAVKYGDTVSVDKTGISDWMYLDTLSHKIHGAYTIHETRKRLSSEEQKKLDAELEGTLE